MKNCSNFLPQLIKQHLASTICPILYKVVVSFKPNLNHLKSTFLRFRPQFPTTPNFGPIHTQTTLIQELRPDTTKTY